MLKNRLLIFIALFPSLLVAQQRSEIDMSLINQRIEFILEELEGEEIDVFTIQSSLQDYFEHPIDLNNTDYQELSSLMLLNDIQILNLLKHRIVNSEMQSIYELQAIDGFDLNTIDLILPFVQVNENKSIWNNISEKEFKHEVASIYSRVLETQRGFIKDSLGESPYLGSPDQLQMRYHGRSRNTSFGIIAEKDAGEEFFRGSQKQGFDYYSAHFYTKNLGFVKQLALGDYRFEYGQGLSLWTSRAFSKSADVYAVKRNATLITPSRSIDGNYFFRGAASHFGSDKWQATVFTSYNNFDATIQNLDSFQLGADDQIIFNSFSNNGNHRTQSEVDKKFTTAAFYGGFSPRFKHKNGHISLMAANRTITKGLLQGNSTLYKSFATDTAQSSTQLALEYQHNLNNTIFYGEVSKNLNGGIGMTHGLISSLDKKVSLILQYRYLPYNFISLIPQPIRESSPYNEIGLYAGLELKFNPKWWFTAYIDQFKNHWISRTSSKPSVGYEYLAQLNFKPKRGTVIYARYRLEDKNRIDSDAELLSQENIKTLRHNARIHFSHKINKTWAIRTRVEFTRYDFTAKNIGWYAYQDLLYKPMMGKFSFIARYSIFDTDGWDARVYAYEHETLYTFLVPPNYNQGQRAYFLCTYKPFKGLMIQAKIAQSLFSDITEISSGNSLIDGNAKTTGKVLIKYTF